MDEFERLEEDLKKLYNEYIDKFRCLAFLEAEVEEYERNEEAKMKERQVRPDCSWFLRCYGLLGSR